MSEIPKFGCVNHDCDKCQALEQPAREWVGLTDEDLEFWTEELGQGELGRGVLCAVAEHLKEKNT